MSRNLRKQLKKQLPDVRNNKAKVNVGKNGLTPALIKEISIQLGIHLIIKVRFLQNFLADDFDAEITKITKKTKSQFVEKRGKTVILYRSRVVD